MAKGQVTEKDLEQSLKTLGGLGGLSAATGARRDSPFGSDFVKRPQTPAPSAPAQPVVTQAVEPQPVVNIAPHVVSAPELEEQPKPVKTIDLKRAGEGMAPKLAPARKVKTAPLPKEEEPKFEVQPSSRKIIPKADTLTERVTVIMSPEMREDVSALAAQLQRRKTDRSTERITANTVMRVAIQALLDAFEVGEEDRPNTEDELLEVVKAKLGRIG